MYGQNDNGWDQGAIFLHPGAVWLSPFGAAQQMLGHAFEPLVVLPTVVPADAVVDAQALRSAGGERMVVRLANWGTRAICQSAVRERSAFAWISWFLN